jgi:Na+/H+ antiporter NhaD/arsenite permease-like protein
VSPPVSALDADMLAAALILVAAYALIFSEAIHRTSAALIGALVMVAVGLLMGFYDEQAALRAVDANTMLLLAAMMMLVAMLRPTGVFDFTAIVIARATAHDPRLLLVYLGLVVSLISMLLDNVTILIVFAPLTVLIARILELNPLPLLMSGVRNTARAAASPPGAL